MGGLYAYMKKQESYSVTEMKLLLLLLVREGIGVSHTHFTLPVCEFMANKKEGNERWGFLSLSGPSSLCQNTDP